METNLDFPLEANSNSTSNDNTNSLSEDIEISKIDEINNNPTSTSNSTKKISKFRYVEFLNQHRWKILILGCCIVAGLAYYALTLFGNLSPMGLTDPTSQSSTTTTLFTTHFVSPAPDVLVILEHPQWPVHSVEFESAFKLFKTNLIQHIPQTYGILDTFDYPNLNGLISSTGNKTLMTIRLQHPKAVTYNDLVACTAGSELIIHFGGTEVTTTEITESLGSDLGHVEAGSIPVLFFVLLFAYGGVIATTVPGIIAVWTLSLTLTSLHLSTLSFPVSTYVTNVATAFGLGISIDYSIFMHLRFCEEIKLNGDGPDAILNAVERMLLTSGRTVAFSAILLITTLSGALLYNLYFLYSMALTIMFIALFAAIGTFTIIPAYYLVLGKNIFYLSTDPIVAKLSEWWILSVDYIRSVRCEFGETRPTLQSQVSRTMYRLMSFRSESSSIPPTPRGQLYEAPDSLTDGFSHKIKIVPHISTDIDVEMSPSPNPDNETSSSVKMKDSESHESNFGLDNAEVKDDDDTITAKSTITPEIISSNDIEGEASESKESKESRTAIKDYPFSLQTEEDSHDIWFRSVLFVVRYPWPFLIGMSGCLIALAVVFILKVRLASFDWTNLPVTSPLRYTYETLYYQFPDSGKSGMDVFLMTSQNITNNTAFIIAIDDFCTELESFDFMTSVASMVRINKRLALPDYIVIYSNPTAPQFAALTAEVKDPLYYTDFELVARVSLSSSLSTSDPLLGRSVRDVRALLASSFKYENGSSMLTASGVTGSAAVQYDTNQDIQSTFPAFVAVIVCTMMLFVFLLTGSIFLPLKAIAMSFLSITASFAFLVLVFQDNNSSPLITFNNNFGCLDSVQLLFIFVVSFGLSLDYEVFILGRIQEIYERTGDNSYAIAKGISSSARSVTIAAILICIAVGGFIKSSILLLQMIGLGVALTILIDATLIRCVLIPATMSIMGSYNWYAPKRVKEVIDRLGLKDY